MNLPGNFHTAPRLTSLWRSVLIVSAVCFLTINVVTRYSMAGYDISNVKTARVAKVSPQESQRQRLLGNGLHWVSPAAASSLFQPPRVSVPAVSAVFVAINLESESWLYKRPPPSSY